VFFFHFKIKKAIRINHRLKNIHEGQRCFILGAGPSLNNLTQDQIEKLRSEVVFAVNRTYKAKIAETVTPQYYFLMDNMFWQDTLRYIYLDIFKKYETKPPVIFTSYQAKPVVEEMGIEKNIIFLYEKKFPVANHEYCIHKNTYISQNVVITAIKAAMYMGFKEIYLLGCDYTGFIPKENNHCYIEDVEETRRAETQEESKYNYNLNLALFLESYARATKFHYLIAKYAEKNQIKIINITPGSLLDAYPRKRTSIVL